MNVKRSIDQIIRYAEESLGAGCGDWEAVDLMRAAPELLEACRKARTCRSIDSNVDALLRNAIAKAKRNEGKPLS